MHAYDQSLVNTQHDHRIFIVNQDMNNWNF